ncbi:unnamed protein product [Prorocentrum cordatum]|uniref:PDZ domain-containing protein n=1 Tax=Prorocentrum cordatum TaxID=2364126 RepID=A0ABN9V7U9_9DINO|nr:unnamed protein product [Polarella glacialis]
MASSRGCHGCLGPLLSSPGPAEERARRHQASRGRPGRTQQAGAHRGGADPSRRGRPLARPVAQAEAPRSGTELAKQGRPAAGPAPMADVPGGSAELATRPAAEAEVPEGGTEPAKQGWPVAEPGAAAAVESAALASAVQVGGHGAVAPEADASVIAAQCGRAHATETGSLRQCGPTPERAVWSVGLTKQTGLCASGSQVGIEVCPYPSKFSGYALKVVAITSGLVQRWNADQPGKKIQLDDLITECNGVMGDHHAIAQAIKRNTDIRLTISRRSRWQADNSVLRDDTDGLFFRPTPSGLEQKDGLSQDDLVMWGSCVDGVPMPDGQWLQVEGKGYLPIVLRNIQVLRLQEFLELSLHRAHAHAKRGGCTPCRGRSCREAWARQQVWAV